MQEAKEQEDKKLEVSTRGRCGLQKEKPQEITLVLAQTITRDIIWHLKEATSRLL